MRADFAIITIGALLAASSIALPLGRHESVEIDAALATNIEDDSHPLEPSYEGNHVLGIETAQKSQSEQPHHSIQDVEPNQTTSHTKLRFPFPARDATAALFAVDPSKAHELDDGPSRNSEYAISTQDDDDDDDYSSSSSTGDGNWYQEMVRSRNFPTLTWVVVYFDVASVLMFALLVLHSDFVWNLLFCVSGQRSTEYEDHAHPFRYHTQRHHRGGLVTNTTTTTTTATMIMTTSLRHAVVVPLTDMSGTSRRYEQYRSTSQILPSTSLSSPRAQAAWLGHDERISSSSTPSFSAAGQSQTIQPSPSSSPYPQRENTASLSGTSHPTSRTMSSASPTPATREQGSKAQKAQALLENMRKCALL